jgi:hypothetical protein
MAELNSADTVLAADHIVHDVGTAFMLHQETMVRSVEFGYGNPFAFYFAGRGGVLGDVDASVVSAAMGWFDPNLLRAMWDEGVAVAGAREAALRYGLACAAWGEEHLSGISGGDRLLQLAESLVAAAEGSALPLFSGWRAEPPAAPGPGRLMQLIHILREWRGGLHLVATTAAGLSPLEAILTNEGEGQARFFGWQGDFPNCDELKSRQQVAQATTNALSGAVYERAFSPSERAEFADLVAGVGSVVLAVPG